MGPQGAPLLFYYEVSIEVLIGFKAILLTPGIFLIQIVNTNIYLIYFYSKNNIKTHFSKSWVFKLQLHTSGFLNFNFILFIHYTSQGDEINFVAISHAFSIECNSPIFKNE